MSFYWKDNQSKSAVMHYVNYVRRLTVLLNQLGMDVRHFGGLNEAVDNRYYGAPSGEESLESYLGKLSAMQTPAISKKSMVKRIRHGYITNIQ